MPSEAVPLEGLSDQDLFDDANGEETAEAVTEPEVIEQPRDDKGQFAEKPIEPEKPETPVAAEAEKPVVDDNAAMVPSWRVREINEEKRVLAEKLTALDEAVKAERIQWQQRQQKPLPEPEKVTKPDPLLDPEGYEKYLENLFEERLLNDRRENSLANAHKTYKGEFDEAYAAAQKQIDPALKARMQQSRDPGETLMEWHREQKTRAEVGNDPNAYFDKRFEAYLADPANQAKVLERIRGGVQPQPRQAPAVDLPPSLTRATNASRDVSVDDNDLSDEGLWRHANA